VSGIAGKPYDLMLWNAKQVTGVEGAKLVKEDNGEMRIRIELAATDSSSYVHGKIVIHFVAGGSRSTTSNRTR